MNGSGSKGKCILLYIMMLLFLKTAAAAEPVNIAIEIWPPFRIIDKEHSDRFKGIDVDLMNEICSRLDLEASFHRLPWARCLEFIKNGDADMITGLARTIEREEYIQYIKPSYYTVSNAFYVQKGKSKLIKSYDDLYHFRIGYSINSAYFEPFNSDVSLKKTGVSTERQLILMLVHGHIDTIVGTDCNVAYDLAQMGLSGSVEQTEYKPETANKLYIGISKKSKFLKQYEIFEAAMEDIVKTGELSRITKKYLE